MKLGKRGWVLMLLLGMPFAGFAQSTLIKINPLSLAAATVNGSVEQYLGAGKSLQLGAYYTDFDFKDVSYWGWAVTPEVRFYLMQQETPSGFYVAPFLRYSQMNLNKEASEQIPALSGKASFLGGGAVAGYQFLLGQQQRVSIDVFAGPRYNSVLSLTGEANENDYKANFVSGGFWLRSGLTVGVAF